MSQTYLCYTVRQNNILENSVCCELETYMSFNVQAYMDRNTENWKDGSWGDQTEWCQQTLERVIWLMSAVPFLQSKPYCKVYLTTNKQTGPSNLTSQWMFACLLKTFDCCKHSLDEHEQTFQLSTNQHCHTLTCLSQTQPVFSKDVTSGLFSFYSFDSTSAHSRLLSREHNTMIPVSSGHLII